MWQQRGHGNDGYVEDAVVQSPTLEIQNVEFPGSRRPIPVSTVQWLSTTMSQFNPINGLDFLVGAKVVHIQQTVELNDIIANVESENRYTVKVPHGETLYVACETSTARDRMLWGSSRPFSMSLVDQTQQEALSLRRRLACSTCCFGCRLQELEVWAPPGDYLGKISQVWSLMVSSFVVVNGANDIVFRIEGPNMWTCKTYDDVKFKVFSFDGLTEQGTISHEWDHLLVGFNLTTTFPSGFTDARSKALLLGASFLLEYMFFERAKTQGWFRCRFCC